MKNSHSNILSIQERKTLLRDGVAELHSSSSQSQQISSSSVQQKTSEQTTHESQETSTTVKKSSFSSSSYSQSQQQQQQQVMQQVTQQQSELAEWQKIATKEKKHVDYAQTSHFNKVIIGFLCWKATCIAAVVTKSRLG